MLRRRMLLGSVLAGTLLAGGLLLGGEQQSTPKGKGRLPLYWNKLGLSDEQRKKAVSIHKEYSEKIEPLKKEISKLEDEEKQQLGKILTDAQKAELRKIIASKALSEPTADEKKSKDQDKPKDEKKPGDK